MSQDAIAFRQIILPDKGGSQPGFGITYLNAAVERIRDCPQANTQQLGDRIGVIFEA